MKRGKKDKSSKQKGRKGRWNEIVRIPVLREWGAA
jgi:hypothetical protein